MGEDLENVTFSPWPPSSSNSLLQANVTKHCESLVRSATGVRVALTNLPLKMRSLETRELERDADVCRTPI